MIIKWNRVGVPGGSDPHARLTLSLARFLWPSGILQTLEMAGAAQEGQGLRIFLFTVELRRLHQVRKRGSREQFQDTGAGAGCT
jgi:hypothetical protein